MAGISGCQPYRPLRKPPLSLSSSPSTDRRTPLTLTSPRAVFHEAPHLDIVRECSSLKFSANHRRKRVLSCSLSVVRLLKVERKRELEREPVERTKL